MSRVCDATRKDAHEHCVGIVRFIIDAQLPRRLALRLCELGHNAVHTFDLPAGNRTTDDTICAIADQEGAVVVTKDADFLITRMLKGSPRRWLVIATGNIRNDELVALLEKNFGRIEGLFETPAHVEMSRVALTVRE